MLFYGRLTGDVCFFIYFILFLCDTKMAERVGETTEVDFEQTDEVT